MRIHIPIRLRWSDFDAYGHVNNAEMLHILEEARIYAFWESDEVDQPASPLGAPLATRMLDGKAGGSTVSLIARQEIEYLAPVPYLRQPIDVQLWLGRLGGASLEICYEVWTPPDLEPAVLYARASTTLVLVDAATDRPRRISAAESAAWEPYLGDPVQFRRRS